MQRSNIPARTMRKPKSVSGTRFLIGRVFTGRAGPWSRNRDSSRQRSERSREDTTRTLYPSFFDVSRRRHKGGTLENPALVITGVRARARLLEGKSGYSV